MALSIDPFEKAGLHVQLADFESLVMEAVGRALPRRPLVDARADLTANEARFLTGAGVPLNDFAPPDLGADSPLVQTAADYAALLATALTVPELASRLGVDQSRIRQRIARRSLIAVKDGASWRLPRYQLDDTGHRLLPGLASVAPRVMQVHPVAAAHWFVQPHPDLVDDSGCAISPRAWLLSGGEPHAVAALADEFHERA